MLKEYRGKWACADWKIADASHRCRRGTELDPEAAALEGQSLAGSGWRPAQSFTDVSVLASWWPVFPIVEISAYGPGPGARGRYYLPGTTCPRDDNPKRSGSHIVKSFEICHIFGEDED